MDRGFIKIQVSLMLLYKASNSEKTVVRPETCFIFIKDLSSNSQESKNIQSSKKIVVQSRKKYSLSFIESTIEK